MRTIALLAVMITGFVCGSANADVIVDDFDQAGLNQVLNDDIGGTRTITTTGTATIAVPGGGVLNATGGNLAGSRIDIIYNFVTPFDMSIPSQHFFDVDLFDSVVGTWTMQGFFTNSLNVTASPSTHTVNSPGPRFWSNTQLPAGIANDIVRVQLRLSRQSNGATFGATSGSISAIPEPTSMILLVTGMAGLVAVRRRRQINK